MRFSRFAPLLAACVLSSAPGLRAQAPSDPSGHWEGAIHAPFGEVNVEIDVARDAKGKLAGTFSNPHDNLKGFPLASVAVEERSVRMLLKADSGGGAFEGKLSANAQSITGVFITAEGGYSVGFDLTRTGDSQMAAAPRSPRIGKELEGSWDGTLDFSGTPKRLRLTMTNQSDGTAMGSLVTVDDGVEFPMAITQKASSVTLEMKTVGISYSGTLNAAGGELAGTFQEGTFTAPLTFRRAVE